MYLIFKRQCGSQAVNSSDFKSVGLGLNPGLKKRLLRTLFLYPYVKRGIGDILLGGERVRRQLCRDFIARLCGPRSTSEHKRHFIIL